MQDKISQNDEVVNEIKNLKEELKQIKEELRLKKITLEVTQENSKIGSWEWDIKNDSMIFSKELTQLLDVEKSHYNSDEFMSLLEKIIDPKDIERVKNFTENHKKGILESFECRIVKNNLSRWILANSPQVVNFEADGLPSLLIGTIQDITESKKSSLESKQLLDLIEKDKNFIGLLDINGKLDYINKSGLNLIGLNSLDEAKEKFNLDFIGEFDSEVKTRLMAEGFLKGESVISNFKIREEIYIEYNTFLLNISEDEIAIAVVLLDITKQKIFENALRESRRRFKELVDLLPIPVFETDLDVKITFVNKTALDYFGYSSTDLIFGIPAQSFIYEEDRLKLKKRAQAIIRKKTEGFGEYKVVDKDGKTKTAIVYVSVILEENEPVGLRGALIDITERKEFETKINSQLIEIKNQRNELKIKTDELSKLNTVLEKSEKELVVLNKNKDVFFSIIAHDLKSPFSSLLGFTEILAEDYDELDDASRKQMIDSLYQSSRGIFALLEDLLAWARTQSGRLEFNPDMVDLSVIANRVQDLLVEKAANKNIDLINHIKEEAFAFCDFNMVNTVLRNLAVNAVKFTPENGLVTLIAEKKNDLLEVTVSDTGIGLSEEDLSKLFRIDVNVNKIGKSKEKGTGIGLILCKELIEKNGGEIWVESEFGKGSQFKFTLKLNK